MQASYVNNLINILFIVILFSCSVTQYVIDERLENLTCVVIAFLVSASTSVYVFNVKRFRRTPLSSLMILGFNISSLSASLLIQTAAGTSLIYNLEVPTTTFLALAMTQIVVIVTHWVYLNSSLILNLRFYISRSIFRPLGLLKAPSDLQLWLFGLVGCVATVVSAPLLIVVAMANNARETFSAGFLTLILCVGIATISGNLRITRRSIVALVFAVIVGVPFFSIMSDLATAMVIARDERSNVSPFELIEITLSNFQDKNLIDDRRRRDAAISGGDYNENYVSNPILARFVYTKFTDVNMTNAISLSNRQAEEVRSNTWTRIISMMPTPVLDYYGIRVGKSDLQYSSGDVYSFIAKGLELGGYTTGSEVPDGIIIFGPLFWPILGVLLIVQYIVYDAMSALDEYGTLRISPVALLNAVPIFTLGVMQESVSNQVAAIVRGIPQLILLYVVIYLITKILEHAAFAMIPLK